MYNTFEKLTLTKPKVIFVRIRINTIIMISIGIAEDDLKIPYVT
jgi:hypothetical protein